MSSSEPTLGLACKLYVNSATPQTPTWVEIDLVIDLGMNEEMSDADVTTRGAQGWRQREPALKDAQVDGTLLDLPADPGYILLQDAYDATALIEVIVANGDAIGGQADEFHGLRMFAKVLGWRLTQNLEEGAVRDFSLVPARGAEPPTRFSSPYVAPTAQAVQEMTIAQRASAARTEAIVKSNIARRAKQFPKLEEQLKQMTAEQKAEPIKA